MNRQMDEWREERASRQSGFSWFLALVFRRFFDFFRASSILLIGTLPGILLALWGSWGQSLPVTLLGGLLGGLAGGPLLCGLYGTILRALRGEPGFWSLSYKHTLKQNWRDALLPGTVWGLILALWLFEARLLTAQESLGPVALLALAEVLFFVLGLAAYMFPQIVLVRVSARNIYFNSIRLFIGLLPRSAASAAVQTVYWGWFLLCLPRSVPMLMITGVWLPCLLSLLILREPLERLLGLEEEVPQ